jgi:hypothetical protein
MPPESAGLWEKKLKGHSGKKQCLSFAGDNVKMNRDE